MGLEIERKYLHINLQSLRQKLVDCGAHCLGVHFESNWVYDSAEGGLVGGGQLLRLRSQQWREVGLGAQILRDLGVRSIVNLASSPRSFVGLSGFGIEIAGTAPLE